MTKPLVAIVGRPNVGKSTFFNKVIGKRLSIVEDKPGVTRDRLYYDTEWCGYAFTMVDTGGIELKSDDKMWLHIKKQAELAVELADVIVFFVDGKQGIIPEDFDIANYLRMSKKPVVLAVNKLDNNEQDLIYDFYQLGIGDPIGISAEQSKGLGDLLDEIVKNFKGGVEPKEDEEVLNIAVVGKPNAGKSSLVNKILGYERVIVSNVAGTTRDAVDTTFQWNGRKFNIIDTAGMRKKSNIDDEVEQPIPRRKSWPPKCAGTTPTPRWTWPGTRASVRWTPTSCGRPPWIPKSGPCAGSPWTTPPLPTRSSPSSWARRWSPGRTSSSATPSTPPILITKGGNPYV